MKNFYIDSSITSEKILKMLEYGEYGFVSIKDSLQGGQSFDKKLLEVVKYIIKEDDSSIEEKIIHVKELLSNVE